MTISDQLPATGGAIKKITPANYNTSALNYREKLALRRLQKGSCDRWELARAIGRGYAPDVVQYLRIKGIPVITTMTKVGYKNNPIGIYSLGYGGDENA